LTNLVGFGNEIQKSKKEVDKLALFSQTNSVKDNKSEPENSSDISSKNKK
jgi:hypothetical protein